MSFDFSDRAVRDAFDRGWVARQQGEPEAANPHDQIQAATAWALGWHSSAGMLPGWLTRQARQAGLLAATRQPALRED